MGMTSYGLDDPANQPSLPYYIDVAYQAVGAYSGDIRLLTSEPGRGDSEVTLFLTADDARLVARALNWAADKADEILGVSPPSP